MTEEYFDKQGGKFYTYEEIRKNFRYEPEEIPDYFDVLLDQHYSLNLTAIELAELVNILTEVTLYCGRRGATLQRICKKVEKLVCDGGIPVQIKPDIGEPRMSAYYGSSYEFWTNWDEWKKTHPNEDPYGLPKITYEEEIEDEA